MDPKILIVKPEEESGVSRSFTIDSFAKFLEISRNGLCSEEADEFSGISRRPVISPAAWRADRVKSGQTNRPDSAVRTSSNFRTGWQIRRCLPARTRHRSKHAITLFNWSAFRLETERRKCACVQRGSIESRKDSSHLA